MKKITVGIFLFLLVQFGGASPVFARSAPSNHVDWIKNAKAYQLELRRQEEDYPINCDMTVMSNFAATEGQLKHKKAVIYRLSKKHNYLVPVKKVSWLELTTQKGVNVYQVSRIKRPAIYYQINYKEGNRSHRYFIWRGYVSRPYRLISVNKASNWTHWTIADSPKAP